MRKTRLGIGAEIHQRLRAIAEYHGRYRKVCDQAFPTMVSAPLGSFNMAQNDIPSVERDDRVLSIDALRGFDMFWIMGGDALGAARRVGGAAAWGGCRGAVEHVKWAGFRFYDLIFPLFLFLVGTVLPFSLAKVQRGVPGSVPI